MSKKIIFAMLVAGAIVTSCIGCGDEEKAKKEDDTSESVEISEVDIEEPRFTLMEREHPISLKGRDNQVVYVKGLIRKPSLVSFERVNSKVSKSINAVLANAYDRNDASAEDLMDVAMDFALSDSDKANTFPWSINTDYDLVRNDGKVVTLKEVVDYYAGEANVVSTFYYNFDVEDGKQITQLFYTEGDDTERDAIDDVIYNKLRDKYGEIISYDNVTSSFVETAVDAWFFTENGIKVQFNYYEIAPDVTENFEIELTKDELPEFAHKYFLD